MEKQIQPKGKWGKDRKEVDIDKVNALWLEGYTYMEIPLLLNITRMHLWKKRKERGEVNVRPLSERIIHLTNREKLRNENKIPFKCD